MSGVNPHYGSPPARDPSSQYVNQYGPANISSLGQYTYAKSSNAITNVYQRAIYQNADHIYQRANYEKANQQYGQLVLSPTSTDNQYTFIQKDESSDSTVDNQYTFIQKDESSDSTVSKTNDTAAKTFSHIQKDESSDSTVSKTNDTAAKTFSQNSKAKSKPGLLGRIRIALKRLFRIGKGNKNQTKETSGYTPAPHRTDLEKGKLPITQGYQSVPYGAAPHREEYIEVTIKPVNPNNLDGRYAAAPAHQPQTNQYANVPYPLYTEHTVVQLSTDNNYTSVRAALLKKEEQQPASKAKANYSKLPSEAEMVLKEDLAKLKELERAINQHHGPYSVERYIENWEPIAKLEQKYIGVGGSDAHKVMKVISHISKKDPVKTMVIRLKKMAKKIDHLGHSNEQMALFNKMHPVIDELAIWRASMIEKNSQPLVQKLNRGIEEADNFLAEAKNLLKPAFNKTEELITSYPQKREKILENPRNVQRIIEFEKYHGKEHKLSPMIESIKRDFPKYFQS